MSRWKRMKGIKGPLVCPKCSRNYFEDEYDEFEDLCVYCLYEGVTPYKPAEIDHSHGNPRNVTDTRKMLDNLDYIPEKQGKAARESLKRHNNRKLYK